MGVEHHLDDADLHQFVNQKTQKPVDFQYLAFEFESKPVGILAIPIQKRPVYLLNDFGRVKANTVYLRDSSSTRIASPDEIAGFGAESSITSPSALELEWGDEVTRDRISTIRVINPVVLDPLEPESIMPAPEPRKFGFPRAFEEPRSYYEDLIEYTRTMLMVRPLFFSLRNSNATTARQIRFEGEIIADGLIEVRDKLPERPRTRLAFASDSSYFATPRPRPTNIQVQSLPDRFRVWTEFGDVRPNEEVWTTSPLWAGSPQSVLARLEGELIGDDLPSPISCSLQLRIDNQHRMMTQADVDKFMYGDFD